MFKNMKASIFLVTILFILSIVVSAFFIDYFTALPGEIVSSFLFTSFGQILVELCTVIICCSLLSLLDIKKAIRLRVIRKTINQEKIARIVKKRDKNSDYKGRVYAAAIEKLTDQSLLADVARNAFHGEVRLAAIEKLTDQNQRSEERRVAKEWQGGISAGGFL
ncbi:MAG: hypothetical protein LBF09_03840, partial [Odoribacteraceae bacterium]|nr:hypothetical protein [Odoribacteraceae bacterium]